MIHVERKKEKIICKRIPSNKKSKMTKREQRIAMLYIGSPTPQVWEYQTSLSYYMNHTFKETAQEHKRRLKLFDKAWKEYHKQRKIELNELYKLLKEEETCQKIK